MSEEVLISYFLSFITIAGSLIMIVTSKRTLKNEEERYLRYEKEYNDCKSEILEKYERRLKEKP